MPLRVSIPQAVHNALATYLSNVLLGGVTVTPRWPSATTASAEKVISVLRTGDVEYISSTVTPVSSTVTGPNTVQTVWAAFQCTMPMQLDVWARSEPARDDLIAQLGDALNAGTSVISATADPVAEGVVLNLGDGYDGTAEYLLRTPRPMNVGEQVQRSEYRATSRGEARFVLTMRTTSPRILQLSLKQRLHESPTAPTSLLNDIVSITGSGESFSYGP